MTALILYLEPIVRFDFVDVILFFFLGAFLTGITVYVVVNAKKDIRDINIDILIKDGTKKKNRNL